MYKEMEQDYIAMFNNKEITTQNAATKAMSLRQIASGGIYTYDKIPMDEEFDAAAELEECLQQLAIAGRKERIEFLIEKQRASGLSDDEKAELTQRH